MYPTACDTYMRVDALPDTEGGFHKIAALANEVRGKLRGTLGKVAERLIPGEPRVLDDLRLAANIILPRDRIKQLSRWGAPPGFNSIPGSKAELFDQILVDDAKKRLVRGVKDMVGNVVSAVGSVPQELTRRAPSLPFTVDFPLFVTYVEAGKNRLNKADKEALARYQSMIGGITPATRIDTRYFDKDGNRTIGRFYGSYLVVNDWDLGVIDQPVEEGKFWKHRELRIRWGKDELSELEIPITPALPTTGNKLLGHDKRSRLRNPDKPSIMERFRIRAPKAA